MKPILIAGLFTLTTALATSTLAATEAPGKHHQRHMERMASELQLTEQQQEQLRGIHQQQQREQMRTLREQRQEQVNAVLTEEQRSKLQELREQRREEMRKHMQERRQGRGAERDADTN